jgi:SAM-dependent methyltransferase
MSVRRAEIIGDLLKNVRGARILDLGSGSGTVSLPLLPKCDNLTLVDYSEAALNIARSRVPPECLEKIDFRLDDIFHFTGDEPFDVVLCIGVLAHVDSTEEALRCIVRNLIPGGKCVVQLTPTDSVLSWSFFGLDRLRRLKYRRTPSKDVIAAASAMGLKLIDRRRHLVIVPGAAHLLGPALLWFDRWIERSPLARLGVSDLLLFQSSG